jgi:hypothetical protein
MFAPNDQPEKKEKDRNGIYIYPSPESKFTPLTFPIFANKMTRVKKSIMPPQTHAA